MDLVFDGFPVEEWRARDVQGKVEGDDFASVDVIMGSFADTEWCEEVEPS